MVDRDNWEKKRKLFYLQSYDNTVLLGNTIHFNFDPTLSKLHKMIDVERLI